MKRRRTAALLCACLFLSACGKETAPVPKEYTAENGWFSVTMPSGMEQSDRQLLEDASLTILTSGDSGLEVSAFVYGSDKNSDFTNGEAETLEEYRDYICSVLEKDDTSFRWNEETELEIEGMERCIFGNGELIYKNVRGAASVWYLESPGRYYTVMAVGSQKAMEKVRPLFAFRELEGAVLETSMDFIAGMTAAVDPEGGVSRFLSVKAMEDAGDDLSEIQEQAVKNLEEQWAVGDKESLFATAAWLMEDGHNGDALALLEEMEIGEDMDKETFDGLLEERELSGEEQTYLSAAWDARDEFGDHAISAWDLSRVPSLMSLGYAAGFCTYEEGLDQCLKAAELAQASFDSWEEFNKSCLYGYSYWSETSADDAESSAGELAASMEALLSQEDGPFRTDFHMELENVWQQ